MLSAIVSRFFLAVIRVYQRIISPLLPARCRYYPTCSEYGVTAIKWHGPRIGGLLTAKRIARCHPLGGHGIDFVPLPLYKDIFYPVLGATAKVPRSSSLSSPPRHPVLDLTHSLTIVSRETILLERGIYKDISSYVARLNRLL